MSRRHNQNVPLISLVSAVLFIGLVICAVVSRTINSSSTPVMYFLVGICVATIPSLIASFYAETTARLLSEKASDDTKPIRRIGQ